MRSLVGSYKDNAFRISVKLDESIPEEDDEAPAILLQVSFPEEYPDVAPDLDILPAADGPKHPLLDLSRDKQTLLESLQVPIEESMGMSMVFSIHAALKENAERLIAERISANEARKEAEAREVEAKENAKFHGTPVNRDTFLAWRDQFMKEMAEKEQRELEEKEAEERKKRGKVEEKKLTGKQLWERGLAGKGDDEAVDSEDMIATGVSKIGVSG
ncbi:putative rwd domain protein [Phaeomoniella chlamydospora]|uniref:Putative rwd domain protein n=1 Tax=Phaeomoniella chlamydospora TaxID=158046 RepID=A0A0G2F4E1_PHACM|nr:putative rwd domain protein [Phaeomoniella chlamydospora]